MNIAEFSRGLLECIERDIENKTPDRLSNCLNHPCMPFFLEAIENYAKDQSIKPTKAAADMIQVLNEIQSIWRGHLLLEGLDQLTHAKSQSNTFTT